MKKIFVGLLAVSVLGFAFTYSPKNEVKTVKTETLENVDGINFFHGTWNEAKAKAKKENKLIFLDAYTDWCGWCKRLDATTLKNKEVGEFFNKNFINVHMEMEKSKDGPRLSRALRIKGYPALFFMNSNEESKHMISGYVKADRILEEAKVALSKK